RPSSDRRLCHVTCATPANSSAPDDLADARQSGSTSAGEDRFTSLQTSRSSARGDFPSRGSDPRLEASVKPSLPHFPDTSTTCLRCSMPCRRMRPPGWWEARWAAGSRLDASLEAPERVAGLVLLAPTVSGDPEPDEEAYIAATDGLAVAIDTAWRAGD